MAGQIIGNQDNKHKNISTYQILIVFQQKSVKARRYHCVYVCLVAKTVELPAKPLHQSHTQTHWHGTEQGHLMLYK